MNFITGYLKYGRQWSKISEEMVITRNTIQVTAHAQKFFDQLKKKKKTQVDQITLCITKE